MFKTKKAFPIIPSRSCLVNRRPIVMPSGSVGLRPVAPEGNFRPTWYTQFRLADGSTLYTMYENVKDLCLSTIYDSDGILSMMHTGYPKTQEDAERLAKKIIEEQNKAPQD